jgi:hypothetical protein
MKLILHIGMHKCGSTAIQHFLSSNFDYLQAEGFFIPRFSYAGHHGMVFPWIELPECYRLSLSPVDHWKNLVKMADGFKTVILSSEEFSRSLPNSVRFQDIETWASDFDEIQIVLILRNQLEFLESVYKEISREKPFNSFHEVIQCWVDSTYADGLDLCYLRLIDRIKDCTNKVKVDVLLYENLIDSELGLIGSFLKMIGSNCNGDELIINSSYDSLAVELCRNATKEYVVSKDLILAAREFLSERHGPYISTLYTKQQERYVFQSFFDHNLKLIKKLDANAEDSFSFLPDFLQKNKI